MNSKFYIQTFLVFIALSMHLSANTYAATLEDTSIRLPAITSYWKTEDSVNKPTITMEEIEKCVGSDSKIRKQYDAYQEASAKISAESKELEKQINGLSGDREAMRAEGALIDAEIVKINSKNSEMEKERIDINALSANKKMDAAAVKNANLKINAFNTKINQLNTERSALKSRIEALIERQKSFNLISTPIKERADSFNEKVAQFKAQQSDIEATIISYQDKCTGSRELVK